MNEMLIEFDLLSIHLTPQEGSDQNSEKAKILKSSSISNRKHTNQTHQTIPNINNQLSNRCRSCHLNTNHLHQRLIYPQVSIILNHQPSIWENMK